MIPADKSEKRKRPMPTWARLVALLLGLLLFPGAGITLFVVRPLDTPLTSVAVGSTLAGGTLLAAAWSGEWPLFIY